MSKVKVQQFVADWYEKNKNDLEFKIWEYIRFWEYQDHTPFFNFMNHSNNNPLETLFRMKDGYEIIDEPQKYYVILARNKQGWKYQFLNDSGEIDYCDYKENVEQLTEEQIKEIDERFMPFAIKVEEFKEENNVR